MTAPPVPQQLRVEGDAANAFKLLLLLLLSVVALQVSS
jgi:hypothetical protein